MIRTLALSGLFALLASAAGAGPLPDTSGAARSLDPKGEGDPAAITCRIPQHLPGFALQDGLRSQFDHISIVVDTGKVAALKADAVTDYISMISLAQLSSLDRCRDLASITNILVPGCTATAESLSVNDAAYLRGVYRADATLAPAAQKGQIVSQMGKARGQ